MPDVVKVTLNGDTLIDISDSTTDASKTLSPYVGYEGDGDRFVGNVASKSSSDLTVSGATVTAPAGLYESAASKSVNSGSATTPATTITANPTISVNDNSGLITASVSASESVTPTVAAGYVSSGTAGTITVSGSNTSQLTTKSAATITPSGTAQTIDAGQYLLGAQTVEAVTTTNLTAANIVSGVTVKVGTTSDDDSVTSVTGTREIPSGSVNITSNGTHDVTSYESAVVNVPETTINSLSVTDNGTYTAPTGTAYSPVTVNVPGTTITSLTATQNGTYTAPSGTAYSPVTVNVEGGGGGGSSEFESGALFIDYDGTIVESYSTSEALALSALPSNPSHTGLTAQGWNWTLAQIQDYLTDYPDSAVVVGQIKLFYI